MYYAIITLLVNYNRFRKLLRLIIPPKRLVLFPPKRLNSPPKRFNRPLKTLNCPPMRVGFALG